MEESRIKLTNEIEEGMSRMCTYGEMIAETNLLENEGISMNTINTLCNILDCEIEDIATHYKLKPRLPKLENRGSFLFSQQESSNNLIMKNP